MSIFTDGSAGDDINFGSGASLDGLTTFSYLFWFYPTAFTDFMVFFAKALANTNGKLLHTNTATTGSYGISINVTGTASTYYESSRSFPLNAWQFLGVTVDLAGASGQRVKFYRGTRTALPALLTTDYFEDGNTPDADGAYNLLLGGYDGGTGNIDARWGAVWVYNRVLTLAEIQRHWLHLERRLTGCVLHTLPGRFGATDARDWSGNGNHGTVTGGTYAVGPPLPLLFDRPRSLPYVVAAGSNDETGGAVAPGVAAGTDQPVFAERGTGSAPGVASGADQPVFAEQGTGTAPSVATGADQPIWAEQGGASAPGTATGADQTVWAETGTGAAPGVVSGSDQPVYAEQGSASAPGTATGADRTVWVERGGGASPGEFSGTSQLIQPGAGNVYSVTGGAIGPGVVTGTDQPVWAEQGIGEAPGAATGADQPIWAETGAGIVPAVGAGADEFTTADTGGAEAPGVASGTGTIGVVTVTGGMGSWVPHWDYTLVGPEVLHGEPLGLPKTERERRERIAQTRAREAADEDEVLELLMLI